MRQRSCEALRARCREICQRQDRGLGSCDGVTGDISVMLRFSDGSSQQARFWNGGPVAAIVALALESAWAKAMQPPGVILTTGTPPAPLSLDAAITADLMRAVIRVWEGDAQASPSQGPLLRAADAAAGRPQEETPSPEAVPQPEAGQPQPVAGRGGAAMSSEQSGDESREAAIRQVMFVASQPRDSAVVALQESNWNTENAINRIMDAQAQAREALRAAPRPAPTTRTSLPLSFQSPQLRSGSGVGTDTLKDCGIGAALGTVSACFVFVWVTLA
uniref:UBA domain-containing protein n=1 Tax=Alexandrium monilatum TaxID=311494 RepID=A0A7S4Q114_9DINO